MQTYFRNERQETERDERGRERKFVGKTKVDVNVALLEQTAGG